MVFVKHRLWVHVLEVFEMVPWIQHRDVVVDELEGVAIAREHQCLVPRLLTHGGQGGDHVITLVPRLFHVPYAQCLQCLLDERQLAQ